MFLSCCYGASQNSRKASGWCFLSISYQLAFLSYIVHIIRPILCHARWKAKFLIYTVVYGLHKWIQIFCLFIQRHVCFVRTLKLSLIVLLLLNLVFYLLFFLNLEGRGQIDVCDPNALTTQCSNSTPHPVSLLLSFVLLQPQHTQIPLNFSFLNAVLDSGQFTWSRKTWMKWNMTGECVEFKYKYSSGHTLMSNKCTLDYFYVKYKQ